MSDPSSEEAPLLDPVSSLLVGPVEDSEPFEPDPQDPKEKAKAILEKGSPGAARRLVQIAEHADAKDAGPACRAILESVGLGKKETGSPAPVSQLLSAAALLGALSGIGKVLGIREVESLKTLTLTEEPFEKTPETLSRAEEPRELPLLASLPRARPADSKSVHLKRLRKAPGTKKKPAKRRGS